MKLTDIAADFQTEAMAAVQSAYAAMEEAGMAAGAIVQVRQFVLVRNIYELRTYYVTRIDVEIVTTRFGGQKPTINLYGFLKRADGTFGNHPHCIGRLESCHLLTPSNEAVMRALKKRGRI